jgi:hypothetical protein
MSHSKRFSKAWLFGSVLFFGVFFALLVVESAASRVLPTEGNHLSDDINTSFSSLQQSNRVYLPIILTPPLIK